MCHAIEGHDRRRAQGARPDPRRRPHDARRRHAAEPAARELARWIANPQRLKPGVNMPATTLSSADLERARRLPGEPEMTTAGRRRSRACNSVPPTGRASAAALERTWRDPPGLRRLARGDQPQGDRQALHRHRVRLLRRRRPARRGDAAAARAARQPPHRPRSVQPALHDARHDDDVPVRRAGDAGDVGLPGAADDRLAQRRLPAHERVRVLGLPVRRADALRRLRAQHRPRRRLVRLRAARRAPTTRPASGSTSGPR